MVSPCNIHSLAKHLHFKPCNYDTADEPGIFDHVIVNENLEKAYECLKTALAKVRSFSLGSIVSFIVYAPSFAGGPCPIFHRQC